MPKNLKQLRNNIAIRLGYTVDDGAELIQAPMIDSILQDAQQSILDEFGTQLPGSTIPAAPFEADDDFPSVSERPLLIKSMIACRVHYRQPSDYEATEWTDWKNGVRGIG